MPIKYEGKDYDFAGLEEHIKQTKPDIKSPGGYVKSIEEAQKGASLDYQLIKTGKKGYECKDCGYSSSDSGSVAKHESDTGHKMSYVGGKNAKEGQYDELESPKNASPLKKKYRTNIQPYQKNSKESEDNDDFNHPFNKEDIDEKLRILKEISGSTYTPPVRNPDYSDLNLRTREQLDHYYERDKMAKLKTKLANLDEDWASMSESEKKEHYEELLRDSSKSTQKEQPKKTNKTGADVLKEDEKFNPITDAMTISTGGETG